MKLEKLKNISGKIVFLIIGICLSLSVYAVRAAWNTPVIPGQPLTPQLWNDMVSKLEDFETRVNDLEAIPADVVACPWEGSKTVCGACHNCQDDLIITCKNGVLTKIEMACNW